jgi:membrane protease YdiL (CAAX protease family)
MKSLVEWVRKEPKGFGETTTTVIQIVLVMLLSTLLGNGLAVLWNLFAPAAINSQELKEIIAERASASLYSVVELLVAAATLEELLYRALPLLATFWLLRRCGKSEYRMQAFGVILIATSVLFGVRHGNSFNIFAQGIDGVIFGLLYLKCGGWEGKFYKPYSLAVATHFLWDVYAVATLVLKH